MEAGREPVRSRLGSVPVVLAALVVAGIALRVWMWAAVTPAVTNLSDSLVYVGMADGELFADPIRQAGYSDLPPRGAPGLRPDRAPRSRSSTCSASRRRLVLYATVRRAGGQVWAAAIAAAAVLLSVDQIFLEHSLMSETLFTFVLALAMYTATRALVAGAERRIGPLSERTVWLLGTGVALGLLPGSASSASHSLPSSRFGPSSRFRPERRTANGGRRAPHAGSRAQLLSPPPPSSSSSPTPSTARPGSRPRRAGGRTLRSAQFADCSTLDPPAGTESLCEETPSDERNGPDFYFFEPESPAVELYGAPPNGDDELGTFGRRAILAQPFAYAEAVARDFARFFILADQGRRDFAGPAYEALEVDREAGPVEEDVAAVFNEYYAPEEYTTHASASTLASVQHALRFHPTLMLISVFLRAAGLFWERGPRRALIAPCLSCSIALLLTAGNGDDLRSPLRDPGRRPAAQPPARSAWRR